MTIVLCTRLSAASFRVSVTPGGPDSGAFSTWTEVRNGPTDAATRSRGRRTRERARGTRRARYGRGRKRERVAEARDARGRILSWKMGEQDPLSLSPFFLSFSNYLSISLAPSLFDEEGAQSGLYEGCRVLSGVRRFGVSTPLVAGKPRRFSRPMRRRLLRRVPYFRSLFIFFVSPSTPLIWEIRWIYTSYRLAGSTDVFVDVIGELIPSWIWHDTEKQHRPDSVSPVVFP